MASISGGGVTVENFWAGTPADRFNDYRPRSPFVGVQHVAMGTGETFAYEYRTDYLVTLTLRDIPADKVEDCLILAAHLDGAGKVVLTTGDAAGRVYPNCQKAPESDAPWPEQDPTTRRWSMSFTLTNLDKTHVVIGY